MDSNQAIHQFLNQCAEAISNKSEDNKSREGATRFIEKLDTAQAKTFSAKTQIVLDDLDAIARSPYTFDFHNIAKSMVWRPSPRTDDNGRLMALSIINDMFDLGDLVAGLLLVSNNQKYPLHQHSPQELYLILSGEADWRYGGSDDYRRLVPGDILYNNPNDIHGVNTNNEALLALYVLWH